MNAKRQIQALNKYDFGNKSAKEVSTYLSKKLNMLGYKVPKYMKEGKISQKQLDIQLNKIYGKLEKIKAKEEFNALPKYQQNAIRQERRYEKAIIDYNTKVAKLRDEITNSNVGSKMKEYLLGNPMITRDRDKAFFNDKYDLKYYDKTRAKFTNINDEIKRLRQASKKMNIEDFTNITNDSKREDDFFINELLPSDILSEMNENERQAMIHYFNRLNASQKNLMIKDRLAELKERYENLLNENEDLFDYTRTKDVFIGQIVRGVEIYEKY